MGARTRGVCLVLLDRRDLRVDGGHAGARGVDFFAAGTRRAVAPRSFTRRGFARPRRRQALSRHVSPRRRIVPLFLRAGIALAAASRIAEGPPRRQPAPTSSRRHIARRGRDLRLRLRDVLRARAGQQEPQLRVGLRPLGVRALERQTQRRAYRASR